MKRIVFLLFIMNLILMCSSSTFPQSAKKTKLNKRKVAEKTVRPSQPKNSDAAFEKKLAETMSESEEWKEYSFATENFKILFPRRYVKKEEPYYDETLGKVNIITYLSLGNNGVFAVGTFPLPYSITDEGVLRKFYQETAKDFLNDEDYKISEVKEINLNGKPALEVSAESVKNKNEVAKIRVILSGKNVFYNLAILIIAENESPQDAVENRVKFEKETTNFFNSFAELPRAANSPAASIPPLFKFH